MRFLGLVYGEDGGPGDEGVELRDLRSSDDVETALGVDDPGALLTAILDPPPSSMTVRLREGMVLASEDADGERRGELAAIVLLEAADLPEAIARAARMPCARRACIELRPLRGEAPRLRLINGGRSDPVAGARPSVTGGTAFASAIAPSTGDRS